MKINLLFIIAFAPLLLWGQGSLEGRAIDEEGRGIPFVQVYFPDLQKGASANEKGEFLVANIPRGWHRVSFSSIGFQKVDTLIRFGGGREHLLLELRPLSEQLNIVEITDRSGEGLVHSRLKNIDGVGIYAAKKNEVIELKNMTANLAANNARQVFARVPGAVVWESDCAGLQLGVGARGLSPDRSSNFNTRQNGYDMAADALGYPESYYSPPMQAIDRIEIVRGAASLQYGTQFGGMINLKLKKGDPERKLSGKTVNTYNSIGFFNTYNELGGQIGKLNYFSYWNNRSGKCNCPNSDFMANTNYLRLGYQFSPRFEMIAEYTRLNYVAQQPGGLTDFQFENDPFQSLRERNWFSVNWNLASVHINYELSPNTKINSRSFALIGSRKAVGYLSPPNRLDQEPLVNRDLLVDYYQNFGNETRLLHRYRLDGQPAAFLIGARAYRGSTEKTQGYGSNGSDADFQFHTDSLKLKSDYYFPSYNMAAFAENVFNLSDRLTLTPGIRYEFIRTSADGYFDSSVRIPHTGKIVIDSVTHETRRRDRDILLAGIGVGYQLPIGVELYSNLSQNYRAITFNDMRVTNPSAAVDPDLQDERGFNFDIGARGNPFRGITFDGSVFWLSYRNKIGSVLTRVRDEFFGERLVRFTTNVADAEIYGVESYVGFDVMKLVAKEVPFALNLFVNLALTQANYHNSSEYAIEGNHVEHVPKVNFKTGLQHRYKGFGSALQFTYLSDQYSEATNAETSPTGVYGRIPSYWVIDLSIDYQWKWLSAEAGINNFANNHYFTRRSTGYPGPGIISSAPRNFYFGLGMRF